MENQEKCIDDSVPLKPQRLMNSLPKLFPPNTHYLCDSGNSMVWSIHYLHPQQGSLLWSCLEYGSMGWAIGSSIGTALSSKNDPVVCITGDGSMLMSGGEVAVALQEQLNIVFLILNDAEYGLVKQGQRMGSGEPTAHTLIQVDFVKWGESMGVPGFHIKTVNDLENLDLVEILSRNGPAILDVYIDPEEIPPIRNRLQALGIIE